MSTPAEQQAATKSSTDSQTGSETLTFEQRVNQTLDSAKLDNNGNIILPEDLSDDLKFAAKAEKRRRDTQSALAKTKSQLSVVEAERDGLVTLAQESGSTIVLTPEEKQELDELKHSDPDAWRTKMNELEQAASKQVQTKIKDVSETAKTKGALGERQVLLDAFNEDNPELSLTDEVIENDIPPRITRALENGDITFTEFLGKAKEYLTSAKAIAADEDVEETPNLSDIGGSDTPGEKASGEQTETDYEKMIF